MNKITAALLGAGQRGMDCYGQYALDHPGAIQFTAVAESNPARLQKFGEAHRIDPGKRFTTWNQLLEQPQLADVILICTQDKMHFEPALQALKKGYHILLEKPMSPDPRECLRLGEAADKANRIFLICHVLRYTDFFATIKKLLDQGRIGCLISIQHNENVAHWHQAHSFVRGNWRRGELRGAMEKNEIEILDFVTKRKERIQLNESESGHGGGDYSLMRDFLRLVRSGGLSDGLTSARISVQSHLMAFAAEKSRIEGKVIEMEGFVRDLGKF